MPATPRSARQERVARVTTTGSVQTATTRHQRAADTRAERSAARRRRLLGEGTVR